MSVFGGRRANLCLFDERSGVLASPPFVRSSPIMFGVSSALGASLAERLAAADEPAAGAHARPPVTSPLPLSHPTTARAAAEPSAAEASAGAVSSLTASLVDQRRRLQVACTQLAEFAAAKEQEADLLKTQVLLLAPAVSGRAEYESVLAALHSQVRRVLLTDTAAHLTRACSCWALRRRLARWRRRTARRLRKLGASKTPLWA